MKRHFIRSLVALASCTVAAVASASVTTQIAVTDFRIGLSALRPVVVPAASFAALVGSTAECEASSGPPLVEERAFAYSGLPFGTVLTSVSGNPFATSAAELAGNFFGAGATVQTSAAASSLTLQSTAQGTIGLVDNVSTSSFTLAPWTVMTISAHVLASASSNDGSPLDLADSGVLMAVSDSQGSGPQFAYVNFNALALGGLGAMDDTEAAFLSLSYENDTAAPMGGLFSGYVSSFASSGMSIVAVPEPASAAMLVAGLLVAGCLFMRRGCPAGRRH